MRAFGARRVRELTGLSVRQLQYWDERGFIRPTLSSGRRRGRRLYDFRDLVALRVAAQLRRQGISLQLIRKVHDHLRQLDYEKPLAELRFWLHEGQLYFNEADTVRAGRRPEQIVAGYLVPVPAIVSELEERIHRLDERRVGVVEKRRGVLGSKPVVAGTRIPVASIRRMAEDGLSTAGILAEYPDLQPDDIEAALAEAPPRRRRSRAS
jgi:DNA-binding transcriptional MerR regulator